MLCFFDFVATSTGCSKSILWEPCAGACNSSTRLLPNPANQPGVSANGSSEFFVSSLFLFCFWIFRDYCPSLLVASLSLRSDTEREDEIDAGLFPQTKCASSLKETCDWVVENELLPELADNPRTTRGTKLSVLQIILFPFLVNRGFWPRTLLIGVSVIFAKLA